VSGFAPGVWVRATTMPADLSPAHNTGMIVRAYQEHDPATGLDHDSTNWIIRFDGLHFERIVPTANLVLLDG
jgi:hypothetical protein